MSSDIPPPHPRPWEEKNPIVSGILAFLIPGAGHFYQGRWFKGAIYLVCILGTFIGGMRLGEGAVVFHQPQQGRITLSYAAQLLTGLVAMPAYFQAMRAGTPSNAPVTARNLTAPMTIPFTGRVHLFGPGSDKGGEGVAVGTLQLQPIRREFGADVDGTFKGTLDGEPVEYSVNGSNFEMAPRIGGGQRRLVECAISRLPDDDHRLSRMLVGYTPRSLADRFEAPPDTETLNELNRRLGTQYDLAMVFTWIAGLLNVLAIWDAIQGPAYGFGDERPAKDDDEPAPAA